MGAKIGPFMMSIFLLDFSQKEACKGAHEIIAVDVQQFFVFHPFTLPQVA
jgi:hypothetical protein